MKNIVNVALKRKKEQYTKNFTTIFNNTLVGKLLLILI